MKQNPTISIIVPVYNTQKYLKKCIKSILSQTFTDFELLLVDDGSTDGSGKICDEFALKDGRIRVFHKQNSGKSSARNDGLKRANGKWIGFVDSDDICEKDMFEVLYENAINHGADISVCDMNTTTIEDLQYNQKNSRDSVLKLDQKQAIISTFIDDTLATSSCNKIYKRDIVLKNSIFFEERNTDTEDAIFVYHVLRYSSFVIFSEQKLYHYIQHKASYTASAKIKDKMSGIKGLLKIINEDKDRDVVKIVEPYVLRHIVKIACYNARHKNFNRKYHKYLMGLVKLNIYKIFFDFKFSVKYKLIVFFLFFPKIFLFIINTKKQIRKFLKRLWQ